MLPTGGAWEVSRTSSALRWIWDRRTALRASQAGIEPQWIEEALAATGSASCRRRKFPATEVIWLVLGMAMFAGSSIRDVVEHLDLVVPGVNSLAPAAIPQARYRVGPEPVEWLFYRTATAWSAAQNADAWRGLALYAIDGSCLRVQDTDENFEHFGKPGGRNGKGDAGYPQVRIACLLHLGTRLLAAATFGPFATSEHEISRRALAVRARLSTLTENRRNRVGSAA